MKILITNDDGIASPSLIDLAEKLSEKHEITVVAPDTQQSGVSSAITFTKPLYIQGKKISEKFKAYSVNGTPVDCVKIAISSLVEKPDLVISGMNQGRNTAINVLYSGTVSGAFEGRIGGIPSLAVSIDSHRVTSTDTAVAVTEEIIDKYFNGKEYSEPLLLNVNIPDLPYDELKGYKLTRVAPSVWADSYEKRKAPYGWDYYWFAGTFDFQENDLRFDDGALRNGYVSVSPLKIDFFNESIFDELLTIEDKEK